MTEKTPVNACPEGVCTAPGVCPLSCVQAGTTVCIKQLSAPSEMTNRLREMGFCEEQQIKLVSRGGNFICQVCHARLGISAELAARIMVAPISPRSAPLQTA